MASSNDITIHRGDSYPIKYTLTDKSTGDPVAVPDGASLTLTVDELRDPTDDTTKLFSVAGVVDSDPSNVGVVNFTPTKLNTAVSGNYFYDIQMNYGDDYTQTVAKAAFKIPQDINKT